MNNINVSIIVPVFNTEKFLRKCIESILVQSYKDFEIILIDDGSTDKSGEICDEYSLKDERIIVIHKENGGVSSARNRGLEVAKGDYISFVDSDDYLDKNWLSNYFINFKFQDLIIQGFYSVKDNEINKTYIPSSNDKKNIITSLILNDNYGYLFVKLFKRELIEINHIRFDENSVFQEDEQFLSLYLRYVKDIGVSKYYGYYYNVPKSRSYYRNINYSLLYTFESLNYIFDGKISKEIIKKRFNSIRDYITISILKRKFVNYFMVDLYKYSLKVLNKRSLLFFVLTHPNSFFSFICLKFFRLFV